MGGETVMEKKRATKTVRIAAFAMCLILCTGCGMISHSKEKTAVIKKEEAESNMPQGETQEKMPETETALPEPETAAPQEKAQEEASAIAWDREAYAGDFAYLTLNDGEQQVYYEILTAMLEHRESVTVSTLDPQALELVYKAVCADYGGLYWVSGYVYTQHTVNGTPVSMDFAPKYTMDYEQRLKLQEQIDASAKEYLAGISVTDSDYEKAKYVFETLVQNVDYDASAKNSQNILSVFLGRATVCQGYACATQYLLHLLGIQSVIVTGSANGQSHAWNLVRLDGDYYYMDTTWGNSRYLDSTSRMEKYVNYNYLAVTSEEISRTHTLDNSFALPECVSMDDNYFVKENRYFEEWNPDAAGAVLAEAWNAGKADAAVKFASSELYEKALDYFITQQYIADYCQNISSVYYIEDEELRVLTFRFSVPPS